MPNRITASTTTVSTPSGTTDAHSSFRISSCSPSMRQKPPPARARGASWARERHGQSAPSPPHRERERPLRARVSEGLPRPVAAQDGLLVDLENHVPGLQPGSVGGAPPDDGGDGGHGRPDASGGLTTLDLRISKEESKFGGDSFPDHRARHGRESHSEEPAPLGAEHRQLALAVRRRRGDEPLEHPRLGDGPFAKRDHDVAALEASVRSGRSLDDLDDHDAEPFADPVARRDLLHLLLREVPDPDAEPRPLSHVRRRRRRQREGEHPGGERERGAGARDHSRPPSSSLTRSSSAPDKRSSRLVTASVSSSSSRSAASGRTAAAIRDRKSTRLNSSHSQISYAVFCLKKKTAMLLRRTHWIFCADIAHQFWGWHFVRSERACSGAGRRRLSEIAPYFARRAPRLDC